jgi:beta-phosphoglucomutase family hydrolase
MTPLGLPGTVSAVLFDLDGVLTSTVAIHRKAWKQAFDEFLRPRCGDGFVPFTASDYVQYVDGRPRREGVRLFLSSRSIAVSDDAVDEIATVKNELFVARLNRGEAACYPGSVHYLAAVRSAGLPIGVVTSSQNAQAVIAAVGLSYFVDARVDGLDVARRCLRGKPAPDAFVAAAGALGVKPRDTAVFEDALAGVQAGKAGGFGYVVGVDRVRDGLHSAGLSAAGADVVVNDLAELLAA